MKISNDELLIKLSEENPEKRYEILEWEVREVVENEWQLVRENPLDFSDSVQRKYFGASAEDWSFPESVNTEAEIPEWKYIDSYHIINPYTKEEREIFEYRDVYIAPKPTKKEIGDKILERAFDNNPHAQIADLTSAVLGLSYLLVQIAGKEAVQQAVGNLIPSIKSASEVRVDELLSPYDVSWLE
jgi:hypothetical protein